MGIVTGILVASAVANVAGQVIAAKKRAKDAKEAAAIQTEAAKKVETRTAQVYDPYLAVGGGAAWTLGELMGIRPSMMPMSMTNPNAGGTVSGPAVPRVTNSRANPNAMNPNQQITGAPDPQPQQTIASIAAQTPTSGAQSLAQQRTQSGYVTEQGEVI